MLTNSYKVQLLQQLAKHGIFGQPAERLLEEMDDHYQAALADLHVSEGTHKLEAQRRAWQILGNPEIIADSVADASRASCLPARRPVVFAGLFFTLLFAATVLFQLSFFAILSVLHVVHFSWIDTHFCERLVNIALSWAPQFTSLALLAALVYRLPIGWRGLFAGGTAAGLATALVVSHYHAGTAGHHYSLTLGPAINGLLEGRVHIDKNLLRNLCHLAFPALTCVGARWLVSRQASLASLKRLAQNL